MQFDRLGNDMSDDIAEALAYEEEKRAREMNHYHQEDELTGYEEHVRDSQGGGDARRCSRHPHVKTSSDDGMFDGDCGECEHEGDMCFHHDEWMKELALTGPVCKDAGYKEVKFCTSRDNGDCYLTYTILNEIPF